MGPNGFERTRRNTGARINTLGFLIAAMVATIKATTYAGGVGSQGGRVAAKLEEMRLKEAAKVVRGGCLETLTYMEFPLRHWTSIRTRIFEYWHR